MLEKLLMTLPVLVITASLVFFSGVTRHTYALGTKRHPSATKAFSDTDKHITAILTNVLVER